MRKKNWLIPLIHTIVWLLFFSLPFWLRPDESHHQRLPRKFFDAWPYLSVMLNGVLAPLFYLNVYWTFPQLISRRRYGRFMLVQCGILFGLYVWGTFINKLFFDSIGPQRPAVYSIFCYLMITTIAFGIYAVRISLETDRRQKEKENANLTAELQFLRWQISPHFLFNVLNNMVALARIKSDHLEPMLHRLSSLMRYMVYESDDRKIDLGKECEYLHSYIELQKIRFGDEVIVDVNCTPGDRQGVEIEPMLLIPFVENAFKHGTGLVEEPVISVYLTVQEKVLSFEVRNKFIPVSGSQDWSHGIGLANVQRRLNLLYENRYDLQIQRTGQWFTASLTLNLD